MTTATGRTPGTAGVRGQAPWTLVLQAAAALAASMGVGRFAYTPILPLMHAQAGLSAQSGSALATANYVGYLAGALLGIVRPAVTRSVLTLRAGLVLVVVTLALMGATENHAAWLALRLVAGIASALVFMIAVSALLTGLRGPRQYLYGWGFGGIGAGIALSGLVVLATGTWRAAWLASAAFALLLAVAAWSLRSGPIPSRPGRPGPGAVPQDGGPPPARRWFAVLLTSYSLEGMGYIIAGTFLVAAINENSPAWAGSGAWVLAGLAAVPASAAWALLSRRWARSTLLCAALLIQATGIALPALASGVFPALLSAVLFGATFLGVASLALALGVQLRYPRAVALLTTGYGLGQILGPLVVTPLLHQGYHLALLIAAGIVLAAALAAAVLRMGPSGTG
jgi:MFS family permease